MDISSLLSTSKNLIDAYFTAFTYFQNQYGKDTCVFIEVGSFFEVYGVDNGVETICNVKEIAEILNLQITRRNKQIVENSRENPLMAGFPSASFDRYIDKLASLRRFTIVIIRQKGTPPNIIRYVDTILSPGINVDHTPAADNDEFASFSIESFNGMYELGFAIFDVVTGDSVVGHVTSTKEDPTKALDECIQLLQGHKVCEYTIHGEEAIIDEAIAYLELSGTIHKKYEKAPKIEKQNELLAHSYDISSYVTPIEALELSTLPLASVALYFGITFIASHNELLIKKLSRPKVYLPQQLVHLGNNPLDQLHILSDRPGETTVFSLYDSTTTAMGRRLLKDRISNPITSISELESRYTLAETLAPCLDQIIPHLRNIYDLDRLTRRITLHTIHPFELPYLHDSLRAFSSIGEVLHTSNVSSPDELVHGAENVLRYIDTTIDLDSAARVATHQIKDSFFKKGFDATLDALDAQRSAAYSYLEQIVKKLEQPFARETTIPSIQIRKTDKEPYHIVLSKNKFLTIEPEVRNMFISIEGTVHAFSDFNYKVQTTNVKISGGYILKISEQIELIDKKIEREVRKKYQEFITYLCQQLEELLPRISQEIARLDVAICTVASANRFNLVKPDLISSERPYLYVQDLRHAIIESIEASGVYVPHTIALGSQEDTKQYELPSYIAESDAPETLLIYGINASGKSSLMKSVGIAVILAQAGFFVPATSCSFVPFQKIFTRIVSKDNYERKLSSFGVEMTELKHILTYADKHSLILGDEISHGTETMSAVSIVHATLRRLADLGSIGLITTHLHQVAPLLEESGCTSILPVHMSVSYNEATDTLEYTRELGRGVGKSIYGLEFAKSLHLDDTFLSYAGETLKKLTNSYSAIDKLIEDKTSKYNSRTYLTACAICSANVNETHHIAHQESADERGMIDHFHKNHKYNLLPVCESCHDKIHRKEITVEGYVMTNKGLQLKYTHQQKKSS